MKKEVIACNLCGDACASGIFGIVADAYGKHSEEYRMVPVAESNTHICPDCDGRLMLMYDRRNTPK